jgi:hypothetical protein
VKAGGKGSPPSRTPIDTSPAIDPAWEGPPLSAIEREGLRDMRERDSGGKVKFGSVDAMSAMSDGLGESFDESQFEILNPANGRMGA